MIRLMPMAMFSDPSGKVAVLFAVILTQILFSVGFAIDAARQVSTAKRVQHAVDAAALAGARALAGGPADLSDVEAIATNAFYANIVSAHSDLDCRNPRIMMDRDAREVEMDASCAIPSTLGVSIMGKSTLSASRSSTAKMQLSSLDVAMMLDISGSMRGQKIEDLKVAAKILATSLLDDNSGDRVRISLIPYATSVNAGPYGNLAMGRAWDDDRFGDGQDIVCVREREGAEKFTDAAPAPGRWVEELRHETRRCDEAALIPLTNDADLILAAIDGLSVKRGYTSGHLGVAWSWYTLSPEWTGIWPAESRPLDYDRDDARKVVIIMSDGEFNKRYEAGSVPDWEAKRDAKELCGNMKRKNVEIYAVGYQISAASGAPGSVSHEYSAETTLRNCASGDSYYMNAATPAELKGIYANIATRLRNLKVTR